MTDTRRLEMVRLLITMFDQCPPTEGIFTPQELIDIEKTLESFKDELEPKQYQVGERVEYKFYGDWVPAHVVSIGKVRVGIQMTQGAWRDLKYVSAKMLKKVKKNDDRA